MKTICIYHSKDLDGWMSAAIVKKWFEESRNNFYMWDLNMNTHVLLEKSTAKPENVLHFLGWHYGDPIPDLSSYEEIIMCDISFPEKAMEELYSIQVKEHGDSFIWIDHHISAINVNSDAIPGNRNTKFAACELTWQYFFPNKKMPEIVRLLGRYDCFGHKGTEEEQDVLEFQYGARSYIENYNEAYTQLHQGIDLIQDAGSSIYEYLCVEAKQTYALGFPIILKEPFVGVHGSGKDDRKFLCVNRNRFNPVNFGIDYHADGYDGVACFWYEKGKWAFSLYNANGLVDCSVIAKSFGGGGHKGASGFVVDDLKKVIH